MTDLAHAQAAIELTAGYVGPSWCDTSVIETELLIVIDPREFWRSCLTSWLDNLGGFEVAGSADVRLSLMPGQLGRASAVILSIGQRGGETWLEQQVAWLREQRPELPIVAILDSDDALTEEAVARLSLQGRIPTSSTMAIAKAALGLIFAGGSYFPCTPPEGLALNGAEPAPIVDVLPLTPNFTPREQRVLELLADGMGNKIMADRLGMSLSTVKVHVHNILSKLKVSNRTAAAMTARNMQSVSGAAAILNRRSDMPARLGGTPSRPQLVPQPPSAMPMLRLRSSPEPSRQARGA